MSGIHTRISRTGGVALALFSKWQRFGSKELTLRSPEHLHTLERAKSLQISSALWACRFFWVVNLHPKKTNRAVRPLLLGVISFSVSQRVQEIGVRMALGADKGSVLRLFIWQHLRVVLAGIAAGTGGALILTRMLSSLSHLLYGVRGSDPMTFAVAALVLIGAAVAASYIPARRAAKVDPMVALRYE